MDTKKAGKVLEDEIASFTDPVEAMIKVSKALFPDLRIERVERFDRHTGQTLTEVYACPVYGTPELLGIINHTPQENQTCPANTSEH